MVSLQSEKLKLMLMRRRKFNLKMKLYHLKRKSFHISLWRPWGCQAWGAFQTKKKCFRACLQRLILSNIKSLSLSLDTYYQSFSSAFSMTRIIRAFLSTKVQSRVGKSLSSPMAFIDNSLYVCTSMPL